MRICSAPEMKPNTAGSRRRRSATRRRVWRPAGRTDGGRGAHEAGRVELVVGAVSRLESVGYGSAVTEHGDEEPAGQSDSAGTPLGPEVWLLEHPRHGTLEVAVGAAALLRAVDPGFPVGKKKADADADADDDADAADDDDADDAEDEDEEGDDEVEEGNDDNDDNVDSVDPESAAGCVVLRDGEMVARARQVGDHKISITADPPGPGEFTTNLKTVTGPRVLMRSNILNTDVRQVSFREGREIVHFDPPPGSAAEARLAAIAASPWKRVVYPVAAGVGKSGWAIAMILLIPILGRLISPVIDWISERIPDLDIPWPDITLPSMPWPDIELPSINLPEVNLPGWVEFLLEYSKVWVPLLVGVALAVVAVRHSRKSRRIKAAWESERGQGRRSDGEAADEK